MRVVVALVTARRGQHEGNSASDIDELLSRRGIFSPLLSGQAQAAVTSSWHPLPIGLLFGLGLETASEVALLAVAAWSAMSGAVSLAALLALPLLFAAGMVMFDTGTPCLFSVCTGPPNEPMSAG